MNQETKKIRLSDSIANQLLIRVFAIYLIIAVSVTGFQLFTNYQRQKEKILDEFITLNLNLGPALAYALWDADTEQLESILNGLLNSPIIQGVKVRDHANSFDEYKGSIIEDPKYRDTINKQSFPNIVFEKSDHLFGYQFPLIHTREGPERQSQLGTLTLYSSSDVLFNQVKSDFIFIILSAIIQYIILWAVFLWLSLLLLHRPLLVLLSISKKINLDNLEKIQIELGSKGNNEFGALEKAFNSMVKKLLEARTELSNQKKGLESLIEKRTFELSISNEKLKKEEEALKKSESKLKAIFSGITDGVLVIDKEGNILESAPTRLGDFKETIEGLVGHNIKNISFDGQQISNDNQQLFLETIQKCLEINNTINIEYQLDFQGETRIFDTLVRPMDTNTVVWVAREITTRKKLEASIKESEAKLKAFFSGITDIIHVVDNEGNFIDIAPTPQNPYQKQAKGLVGKTMYDVFSQSRIERFLSTINQCLQTEQIIDIEYVLDIDGKDVYFNARVAPLSGNRVVWVARDITERKLIEEELQESRDLFNSFADQIPGFVFIKNHEGQVQFVNRNFKEIYPNLEVEGKSVTSFVPESYGHKIEELDQRVLKDGRLHEELDYYLSREKSEKRTIEIHMFRIDRSGKSPLIGTVAFDATVRKQAELELQEAKNAAESANHAKSEFLANMSHELRTPLNAILGFSQIMVKDDEIPPEQRTNIQIINRSGEHLLTLINDILDMAKVEAGRITLMESDFNLHSLLEDIVDLYQSKAAEKGLDLKLEIRSDVPKVVRSDIVKLRQILFNLISNAIKFSHQGGVSLRVIRLDQNTIERSESLLEKTRLLFQVQDTGVGIPSEDQESIFNAFVQSKAGKHSNEGTGLGLAISRKYTELLGGTLEVESNPGKGSCFSFEIDTAFPEELLLDQTTQLSDNLLLKTIDRNLKALIVDDNQGNRKVLSILISELGFQIKEAENGEIAVDVCKSWQPDLVLMDLLMPELDGFGATKRIREDSWIKQPAIIAVSAMAFDIQKKEAFDAGCNAFISKPFLRSNIYEAIQSVLDIEFQRLPEPVKQVFPIAQQINPDDLDSLPPEIYSKLKLAVVTADYDEVMAIINQLSESNISLAESLKNLVSSYRFDKLQELFNTL